MTHGIYAKRSSQQTQITSRNEIEARWFVSFVEAQVINNSITWL